MRLLGLVLKSCYKLNRYRVIVLPVSWVLFLLAFLFLFAFLQGWIPASPRSALGVLLLSLALLLLLLWARHRGYIVFRPHRAPPVPLQPPLVPDEKVFLRASGFFEVDKKRQYFVDVAAAFATMETREHVVMGWIPPSEFLFIRWPRNEVGMWYIFFRPEHIRALELGELCFGWRIRPALRVVYQGKGGLETAYLSFNDLASRQRVLDDLARDASLPQRKASS